MEFIVQIGNNNFPVNAMGKWSRINKVHFPSICFKDSPDLHGKVILFHTNSEVFGLIGSANFTESALMHSSENGGNVKGSCF